MAAARWPPSAQQLNENHSQLLQLPPLGPASVPGMQRPVPSQNPQRSSSTHAPQLV